LLEFIENKGLGILNGIIKGDEDGEFTFTEGKGNTVIDYVIGDKEVKERVKKLRIRDRVESDHHPVELWMEVEGAREEKRWKESGTGGKSGRGVWNEEGREEFRKRIENIVIGQE